MTMPNQSVERMRRSHRLRPAVSCCRPMVLLPTFSGFRRRIAHLFRYATLHDMRTFAILILSCSSVLAADDVRVVTSTTTNSEAASITTTEVFTRGGQTNLVRQTQTKAGTVRVRVHWFYRDGARLATHVMTPDSS